MCSFIKPPLKLNDSFSCVGLACNDYSCNNNARIGKTIWLSSEVTEWIPTVNLNAPERSKIKLKILVRSRRTGQNELQIQSHSALPQLDRDVAYVKGACRQKPHS